MCKKRIPVSCYFLDKSWLWITNSANFVNDSFLNHRL
jgi:hypothetical protein